MILKIVYITIISLFLISCAPRDNDSSNFKVICDIESPDKKMSVIGIKKGISGGATVGYVYEFYFAKNIDNISKEYKFLELKGLDDYNISWSLINTIKMEIHAKQIEQFKNFIYHNKELERYYVVNYAIFK